MKDPLLWTMYLLVGFAGLLAIMGLWALYNAWTLR